MDREDGRGRAADHRDEQRGVPIVRVHDVGGIVRESGRDGAAEERVALRVVGRAIHTVPPDALVRHEHDAHPIALDRRVRHADV